MKNKKGFKHYLLFYIIIVVVYFIYLSILAFRDGGYDPVTLGSILYLPLMFIVFLYLFDTMLDPLFNRMSKGKNKDKQGYSEFYKIITAKINDQCDFSIEDFRRLRENQRFQKALQQALRIKENGETEDLNFVLLEKKFKKNTREDDAMKVVIEEVKKMM